MKNETQILKEVEETRQMVNETTSYEVDYCLELFKCIKNKSKNTMHDCFFEYFGHDRSINIRVSVGGCRHDEYNRVVDNTFNLYFKEKELDKNTFWELLQMIEYGIGLYEQKGIKFKGVEFLSTKDCDISFVKRKEEFLINKRNDVAKETTEVEV